MLDDCAKMMAYKDFVRSKIEYCYLIYWGAVKQGKPTDEIFFLNN